MVAGEVYFFDILPLSSLAQLTAFTKLLYLIITLEVNKQITKIYIEYVRTYS